MLCHGIIVYIDCLVMVARVSSHWAILFVVVSTVGLVDIAFHGYPPPLLIGNRILGMFG